MFIVKARLKKTVRESDTMENIFNGTVMLLRKLAQSHLVWLPKLTMEKGKGRAFLSVVFKGIGLLPPALFFLP